MCLFKYQIQSCYVCFSDGSGSQFAPYYTNCFFFYLKFYLRLNKPTGSKTGYQKRGHIKATTDVRMEGT